MLSWLPVVSFWVTQSCSVRRRGKDALCNSSFWAWIAVPRAVSYTLSFLTPEVNVREVLGPTLTLETASCTRTSLLHHCMLCILSQHEQDSESALYSWDPLAQTNWYPDGPPEKRLSTVRSELSACCWAGVLRSTDLMRLLAAHGPCPRELLHSASTWWAPRCWQLDGQLCSLPELV